MVTAQNAPDWAPIQRGRAHELIIDKIEEQIMSGALRVGDPLPSERDLASRLEVSRAGVREAIRVLEGQGVLVSRVGSGAEAGTFVADETGAALTRLLRLHVGLSNFPVEDLIEARVMLERASVASATTVVTDESLAALSAQLDIMDAEDVTRNDFNEADTAFHVAIAEASGNRLVADMTVAIRGSLRTSILDAFQLVDQWESLKASLREQHRAIFDAIAAGDPERAAHLVEHHIRFAFAEMPGLKPPGE